MIMAPKSSITANAVRKILSEVGTPLPSNDKIKFAFHIQPKRTDTLQRGKVQPANGKRGGGKEAYFANGTSNGTFLKPTPY